MLKQLFLERILNKHKIVFRPERCLHSKDKRSVCQECARLCPAGAININDKVIIDSEKCTVCGICTSVCPTQSLIAEGFSLRQWLHGIATQEKLHIVCQEVKGIFNAARIPCLGMLHEEVLLSIILSRPVKQIVLNISLCQECPSQAMNYIAELLGRWQKVSAALGIEIEVEVCSTHHQSSEVESSLVSRREFFGFFQRRVINTVVDVLEDKFISGQKEKDVLLPERRYILNTLLAQKSLHQESSMMHHFFPQLRIVNDCDICRLCARTCPTGALFDVEDETHYILAFSPNRCVECNLCIQNCPNSCLSASDENSSDYLDSGAYKALRKLPKIYCHSCNKPFTFAQTGNLCEACIKEADIEQSFIDLLL
ncbi:MAG: NADH-quinone oxidoreductase subunit I [Bacillota bacterium]